MKITPTSLADHVGVDRSVVHRMVKAGSINLSLGLDQLA